MKILLETIFLAYMVILHSIQLSAQMSNSNRGNDIARPPAPASNRPPAPAQGHGSAPPAQGSSSAAQRNLISLPIPMPNQRRIYIKSGSDTRFVHYLKVAFDFRVYGHSASDAIYREVHRAHSPPRSPQGSPQGSPSRQNH